MPGKKLQKSRGSVYSPGYTPKDFITQPTNPFGVDNAGINTSENYGEPITTPPPFYPQQEVDIPPALPNQYAYNPPIVPPDFPYLGSGYQQPQYEYPNVAQPVYAEIKSDILATSLSCIYCNTNNIDYIIPICKHLCHYNCFKNANYICKKADNSVDNQEEICSICLYDKNIIKCTECKKRYCYICILNRNLDKCCEVLNEKSKDIKTTCPGCLISSPYSEMSPIKCKSHEFLCKKCFNLSIKLKTCILGCELVNELSYNCTCKACGIKDIKYFGNYYCPDKCEVCDTCQTGYILRNSTKKEDPLCAYCGIHLLKA
jgi:hypothetical protein